MGPICLNISYFSDELEIPGPLAVLNKTGEQNKVFDFVMFCSIPLHFILLCFILFHCISFSYISVSCTSFRFVTLRVAKKTTYA